MDEVRLKEVEWRGQKREDGSILSIWSRGDYSFHRSDGLFTPALGFLEIPLGYPVLQRQKERETHQGCTTVKSQRNSQRVTVPRFIVVSYAVTRVLFSASPVIPPHCLDCACSLWRLSYQLSHIVPPQLQHLLTLALQH